MDQELREFIALSMGQLTTEVSRLSNIVKDQSAMIRQIEITSTTRIAEIQKDIIDIRNDISDIRAEQKELGDSQKFKWKTLSEQREKEEREQSQKDAQQAVINNSMTTVNKLLWAILMIVLPIFIGFVWSLIINGGVKGLVLP